MDVKQIQYFSLVSSTGSFNAAAKQLYISVPGLVKAMDRLENELGVQLFVRRRSGVTLTPAGQALARYAPRYIRKYEMIVSNVRKAAAQREMRAEVCMTWGMLSFFPRNFLSRFVLSNPDMSLSTHNYSLQELEEALNEYRETIGLYFGRIDDPELEILFHREAPLRVLMSSTHALCEKAALRMEDLRGCKVILVNSDPEVMRQLQNRLESVGCPPQIMLDGAEWEQAVEADPERGLYLVLSAAGKPQQRAAPDAGNRGSGADAGFQHGRHAGRGHDGRGASVCGIRGADDDRQPWRRRGKKALSATVREA